MDQAEEFKKQYIVDQTKKRELVSGEVYFGQDPVLGRKVFLKKAKGGAVAARREAEVMARYGISSFMPLVYDCFLADGVFVFEYHYGEPLNEGSHAGVVWPVGKAVRITMNLLRAIRRLHKIKHLHTNIQPSNVFVEDQSTASTMLMDFSCCVPMDENRGYKGPFPGGNWAYMPPEQFVPPNQFQNGNQEQVNTTVKLERSSDLYSAAGICVYLLTGCDPFLADPGTDGAVAYTQLLERHRAGFKCNIEGVEDALAQTLEKALAPNPEDRFQRAQEMLDALRPYEFLDDTEDQQKTKTGSRSLGNRD